MKTKRSTLLLCGTVLAASVASADVLYQYESFSYPANANIDLQNGGTGWSSPWGTPGGLGATVTAASLTSGGLSVAGGALATPGSQPPNQGSSVATWYRNLATQHGLDNTTVYLSFLMRPDVGFGFYGGINFGAGFVGLSGFQSFYGLEGPGNDVSLSTVPVVQGQPVLFVLRADFAQGADTLRLYLNPTVGSPEPGSADVLKTNLDLGLINSLTVNNYGGFTVDEIRLGSTFASVTPSAVPEPGTIWTLGAAALLFGFARRKRG